MVAIQILNSMKKIVLIIILHFALGCVKFSPSSFELSQPSGILLFNYLIDTVLITTEGWNVVSLNSEDTTQLNSLTYSQGKLYMGGTVNYVVDLTTNTKTPWLNGITVNGTSSSSGGVYAISKNYLLSQESTSKIFCPNPTELTLPTVGYLQSGEKVIAGESGDVYIGFKNSISEQRYSTGVTTTNFDCSIYKLNVTSKTSQTSCTSTNSIPMTLFAGTPGSCYFKDGNLTSSYFRDIVDLMYDKERKAIYVCENQAIRKIDISNNQVTTLVGNSLKNFSIVDGDFSKAKMVTIGGCFYKNNSIYFTDKYSIRRLDLITNKVSTLADGKVQNSTQVISDGKGGGVTTTQPGAITGDDSGNLYFIDRVTSFTNPCKTKYKNYLRKVSPPTAVVTKNLLTSTGVSIQDRSVCFSQSKLTVFQDGVSVPNQSDYVFPNTTRNTSVTKTFEIRNQGQDSESFAETANKTYEGTAGIFTLGKITPNILVPGGKAYFTVTFTPTQAMTYYLSITCNDYTRQYGNIYFNIRGTGQ